MKKLLIISVLLLSGCAATIPQYQIDRANWFCKDRGGVYEINTFLVVAVTCNDGTFKQLRFVIVGNKE